MLIPMAGLARETHSDPQVALQRMVLIRSASGGSHSDDLSDRVRQFCPHRLIEFPRIADVSAEPASVSVLLIQRLGRGGGPPAEVEPLSSVRANIMRI